MVRHINSRFHGVFHEPLCALPWAARVVYKDRRTEVGRFAREVDAARAVDAFIVERGLQRKLNFAQPSSVSIGRQRRVDPTAVLSPSRPAGGVRCTTAARMLRCSASTVYKMKRAGVLRDLGGGFVLEADVLARKAEYGVPDVREGPAIEKSRPRRLRPKERAASRLVSTGRSAGAMTTRPTSDMIAGNWSFR